MEMKEGQEAKEASEEGIAEKATRGMSEDDSEDDDEDEDEDASTMQEEEEFIPLGNGGGNERGSNG